MLNLTRLHLGIAHESQFQGLGINADASRLRWLGAMLLRLDYFCSALTVLHGVWRGHRL
jgi:hypothetical protein